MELPFAESWKIKMVEPIRKSTREEREQWIKEAHYNVFQLKSEQVYIDLITDSGTGAMSDRQWAGMMLGDESYAGATSFFKLKEMITKLTGFEYIIPTHQGRAAENVLFSYLVHEGDIVPGNSHFDTTKGHIEGRHATALDCTIDAAKHTQLEIPFKGNVDPDKLQKALTEYAERIPFIIVTITNNTAGGQPVSMQNLHEVRAIADKYGKPVLFDSARFAENAYFIKMREEGYQDKTIKEITREMFSLADGMTMSAKKDGIVNMGGFIATRRADWYEGAKGFCVQYEGYLTYGGMNGRDMNALAIGLDENTEFDNLETRINARINEFDVVVIIRGGGATSDLSGFDTYLLAAACAQFPLPIITGIGHERDDTVLDSVAHTRVKTPTAAAELLIHQVTEVAEHLEELSVRLQQGAYMLFEQEQRRLEALQIRIPNLVHRKLADARFSLLAAKKDLSQVAKALLARQSHRLELLQQRIADASPDKLLSRGYSITIKDGKAVTDASSLKPGDRLTTRLLKGEVQSVVEK